ncbi:MAG: hypothetical protein GY714_31370 [Desulfobacterales bacterium]|nr:hypothetical protein [Desulfobacterales bacterium]MCP4159420.1 hypothetical protein [Deltaproteobacteria bacterium]
MENNENNTVSTGKAFGIIAFVLTISIILFVAPLSIGSKLYIYIFLIVIPCYILFKKNFYKETSQSVFFKGKIWNNLNFAGKVSFVYIACFVLFCGTIQFFRYYFGNDVNFFDITLQYIAFATPLVIHWIYKLFKEKEAALQYISDIFSLWLIGYGLIWCSIILWYLMIESD